MFRLMSAESLTETGGHISKHIYVAVDSSLHFLTGGWSEALIPSTHGPLCYAAHDMTANFPRTSDLREEGSGKGRERDQQNERHSI